MNKQIICNYKLIIINYNKFNTIIIILVSFFIAITFPSTLASALMNKLTQCLAFYWRVNEFCLTSIGFS